MPYSGMSFAVNPVTRYSRPACSALIAGAVDFAHRSDAEAFDDFVIADEIAAC